ncbi:MAG: class I SAM-dependent methyltransferase [Alphaproteobacteria bacterium]
MTVIERIAHAQKTDIPCPVCGANDYTVTYEPWVEENDPAKLYGAASGVTGTQRLVTCAKCSLLYENPRFPAEIIVRGYMASNEAGHDSQHGMRVRSFYSALHKLRRRIPLPGSKVLDIGTAGGAFLDAAEAYGYDAWGMEPSQYLVNKGKERGVKIKQGVIEKHSFELGSFDMVCLWDVLEHIPEPREALAHIRKLLKPDGILLINYPDIDTWQARLAGKRFWWLLSVHLQHFSPATVRNICQHSGFEVFHLAPYWQTLEFGYLERMAAHLKVPLAGVIERLTPGFIQRIPIPYYASQTTALARLA